MHKRDLKNVRDFSADLANLLVYSIDDYVVNAEGLYHVSSLLLLAAGIKRVEYDRSEFDPTLGYCGNADRFQDHQDKLEQLIVDGLTRFMFTWSALESCIDLYISDYSGNFPRGKVNKLCAYLKENFERRGVSEEYKDRLDEINRLSKSDTAYAASLKLRKSADHIGVSGYGISSVYSIRNSLAHGALGVPISREEEEEFLDIELINCCTNIVLNTIQMIITTFYSEHTKKVSWQYEEVDFEMLMATFHLDICISEFEDGLYRA